MPRQSFRRSNRTRGRRSRLASGQLHGRIPRESPTYMRVAFFLVMPNSLLLSSPETRNISKSSRPQTKGTSVTMAAAYDRKPRLRPFQGRRIENPRSGWESGQSRQSKRREARLQARVELQKALATPAGRPHLNMTEIMLRQ